MNLLLERSDILFRFMNFYGFLDMLEHDRLLLTVDVETKGKDDLRVLGGFFASFSRTTLSTYFEKTGVIIVIDGRKLGRRYKLLPIDYWARKSRKTLSKYDEMEERLISRENVVPNFINYIIEAHLLISSNEICVHDTILARILHLAKERGVRLKVHIDVKNLSWTYLKNHDDTEKLHEMLKSCDMLFFPSTTANIFIDDKNRLGAFLDLVQFAEKGGEISKRALTLFYRNFKYIVQSKQMAKDFFIDLILVPLMNNKSPGFAAYPEAVQTAKLFRNRNPIEFVQEVFRKARERIFGSSQ